MLCVHYKREEKREKIKTDDDVCIIAERAMDGGEKNEGDRCGKGLQTVELVLNCLSHNRCGEHGMIHVHDGCTIFSTRTAYQYLIRYWYAGSDTGTQFAWKK